MIVTSRTDPPVTITIDTSVRSIPGGAGEMLGVQVADIADAVEGYAGLGVIRPAVFLGKDNRHRLQGRGAGDLVGAE